MSRGGNRAKSIILYDAISEGKGATYVVGEAITTPKGADLTVVDIRVLLEFVGITYSVVLKDEDSKPHTFIRTYGGRFLVDWIEEPKTRWVRGG